MVPVDSRRIPRVPRYSGYCYVNRRFAYGAVTRYGRSFQNVLLALTVQSRSPTTPAAHCYVAGLGCSPVARHYWGNHGCFLLLEVLICFSSLGSPPQPSCWGYPQKGVGCPIRKSAHQRSFAPTRGLSQLITSFIASVSQGIHHAPLLTFCFAGPVASNADGAARTFCRLTFSTPAPHVRISWSSKDRGHADACLSQYVKDRLGKRRHRSACQIPQCGE